MAKRSSLSPTLTVFGIWWVATAYFSPTYEWQSMVQAGALASFGVLLGVIGATVTVVVLRVGYRGITAPSELRGLKCSIGEVPMPMPPPARAEELPPVSPVSAPDIPPDFIDNWLDEYADAFPAHAALFKALLLVLNHRPDLPATHIAGDHGGRTLLQHSLLTSSIMVEVSRTWTYDGLRDRFGKRVVVPLRDKNYQFKRRDPMVAIIGLAHDIGKIEAYIYNDRGDVVGIRAEHDMTGARMLARMQETWDIPSNDRDAMLLAIAHYHHPVELPMAPDQRKAVARDDRTIALMELLIRADFNVTKLENDGRLPSDEEYKLMDSVRTVGTEQLYDEFVALIHEAHRVNSGNIKYSIGQISPSPDGKGALLYLHEESLRNQMMRRLGLQETEHLGNGRYQITVDLLSVLKARGVLYTTHDDHEYSSGNAMWVCEVLGSKGQKISDWPCVVAVKINHFEKLQQLGFFSSSIKIVRNRFGAHMGKRVSPSASDTAVLGGLGSSNDIPEAPAPRKTKPKPAPAPRQRVAPVAESEIASAPAGGVQEESRQSNAIEEALIVAPAKAPVDLAVERAVEALEQDVPALEKGNPARREPTIATADKPHMPDDTQIQLAAPVMADTPETEAEPIQAPAAQGEALRREGPSSGPDLNPDAVITSLMLAVEFGKAGTIKCRQGDGGNFVFNLDTLLQEMSVAEGLSPDGVIDYLAAGKIKGVSVTRIKTMTLISVTPPISASA